MSLGPTRPLDATVHHDAMRLLDQFASILAPRGDQDTVDYANGISDFIDEAEQFMTASARKTHAELFKRT